MAWIDIDIKPLVLSQQQGLPVVLTLRDGNIIGGVVDSFAPTSTARPASEADIADGAPPGSYVSTKAEDLAVLLTSGEVIILDVVSHITFDESVFDG